MPWRIKSPDQEERELRRGRRWWKVRRRRGAENSGYLAWILLIVLLVAALGLIWAATVSPAPSPPSLADLRPLHLVRC